MDVAVEHTSYPPGFASGWHSHDFAQLIYPSRGVMTLRTKSGTWIVPPLRACWLPAMAEHDVEAPFGLDMLSAYCSGPGLDRLPAESGIVQVSGLLRESILALETGKRPARQHRAIVVVFAGEVRLQTPTQLHLPILRSPKLTRIAAAWRRDPADGRTLEDWARELGMAPRTIAREFQKEARITFTQYRTEFRLQAAIERLAADHSVTTVAYDLGFGSPSNFIAMFRKATGVTPAAYFRQTPT
jgi:AraC-like DNA-binding protein